VSRFSSFHNWGLAGCSLLGCGEDDVIVYPLEHLDGSSLLGFANNRTLNYLQTNTIVSVGSAYGITVTTPDCSEQGVLLSDGRAGEVAPRGWPQQYLEPGRYPLGSNPVK